MPTRVALTITGTPKGKQRAQSGFGRFYTPKETEAEEAHIRMLARKAMAERTPIVGPVMLILEAVFDFPMSWPPRVREMKGLPHVSKPDLDNIEKLVLDACNGVVFLDDGQVCEVRKLKRYGDAARIEVRLEEVVTTVDHPAVKRAAKRLAEEREVSTTKARKQASRRKRAPEAPRPVTIGKRLK